MLVAKPNLVSTWYDPHTVFRYGEPGESAVRAWLATVAEQITPPALFAQNTGLGIFSHVILLLLLTYGYDTTTIQECQHQNFHIDRLPKQQKSSASVGGIFDDFSAMAG